MDVTERKWAEEAVRRSELNLRRLVDGIPGLVFILTADGEVEFVNQQILDYTGRTFEELKRWEITDLVHPDDLPKVIGVNRRSIETGQPHTVEHRLRRADGAYRWFDVSRLAQCDSQGHVIRWYGLLTDIHERKRAEEAVLRSEKELRNVIDTIPAIVWSALPDGSNTYVNRRFVEYSGMSGEQMAGSGWQTAIHPDDLQRHVGKWRASVGTGEPHENEMRFRRADGQYRWHLDRGLPLRDEQGNILKWYGITMEIEDRKRAEEELRRSEASLLDAQRLSRTGSWTHDLSSGTVTISPEAVRMWGIETEDDARSLISFLRECILTTGSGSNKRIERLTSKKLILNRSFGLFFRTERLKTSAVSAIPS